MLYRGHMAIVDLLGSATRLDLMGSLIVPKNGRRGTMTTLVITTGHRFYYGEFQYFPTDGQAKSHNAKAKRACWNYFIITTRPFWRICHDTSPFDFNQDSSEGKPLGLIHLTHHVQ